ncbi:MAG: GNAT family N-acetyltransferase [Lachnospiraceae bacterium]
MPILRTIFTLFYDETKLVGFINLYEEKTEIFFGIGVNPDCCSEGYGQQMTKTACEISKVLFGTKTLYLEVRTWNKRAVSCYQKAGFVIKGEPIRQTTSAGEGVFYHMVQEME